MIRIGDKRASRVAGSGPEIDIKMSTEARQEVYKLSREGYQIVTHKGVAAQDSNWTK